MATLLGKSGIALMIAAVILPFGTESASPAGVPARPTKIVVFGDSLSDTGNAYIGSLHLKAPSPPYFRGRFSNGPIWVEMFARHFGLKAAPALAGGSDFAVGGAKVGSGLDSLPHQADLYLALSIFSRPDPNAVYIIFGGGNDIRRALNRANAAEILADAANGIRDMITRLAGHGAVNFLVPNVPNRGRAPAARMRGTAAKEQALTLIFDTALDAALADLPAKLRINLIRVDLWTRVEEAFAASASLGFVNATNPCLARQGASYAACADPDAYVFWDDIHPTTRAHQILAAAALDAYDAAGGRPSPAPGPSLVDSPHPVMAATPALDQLQSEVLRLVHAHMNGHASR